MKKNSDIRRSLSLITKFLFGKEKYLMTLMFSFAIVIGITPSVDGFFLKALTDFIVELSNYDKESVYYTQIIKWSALYCVWWAGITIVYRIFEYIYLKAVPAIKANIIDHLYNHVQHHSNQFFQNNLAGDITNRVTDAANSLDQILYYFSDKIVRKISVLTFALMTIYFVNSQVALIFLVWLVVFLGTSLFYAKTINQFSLLYARSRTAIAGKIVDAIANIFVIRMFTSHLFERKHLQKYLDRYILADQKMQLFMIKLRIFLGSSCALLIFIVIYHLLTLKMNGVLSTGDCILIVTLFTTVVDDVWDLTVEFGEFFEHLGAFSQVLSLLEDHQIKDEKSAENLVVENASIEFKDVTFKYHRNDNIFKNKSIIIPAKQKVGLVGYSGSGKTTFANLIARLHTIDEGQILIDNQDIATVTQESLRKNITLIPQEPILFNRTILENIAYGKDEAEVSLEEVYDAASRAHIHDFIMSQPDGYDTMCGERGNNLSGGQRQRVIIARAILKNAPILILDEATSSLDTYTETLIQKSMENLMQDKTTIIIAHRLSTLVNMDRILVFNKGHIVEDGIHERLRCAGGIYQKLWDNTML